MGKGNSTAHKEPGVFKCQKKVLPNSCWFQTACDSEKDLTAEVVTLQGLIIPDCN